MTHALNDNTDSTGLQRLKRFSGNYQAIPRPFKSVRAIEGFPQAPSSTPSVTNDVERRLHVVEPRTYSRYEDPTAHYKSGVTSTTSPPSAHNVPYREAEKVKTTVLLVCKKPLSPVLQLSGTCEKHGVSSLDYRSPLKYEELTFPPVCKDFWHNCISKHPSKPVSIQSHSNTLSSSLIHPNPYRVLTRSRSLSGLSTPSMVPWGETSPNCPLECVLPIHPTAARRLYNVVVRSKTSRIPTHSSPSSKVTTTNVQLIDPMPRSHPTQSKKNISKL
ncbi:hypothetical protein PQX77_015878, partial [Marasmius sp. AFHP31]